MAKTQKSKNALNEVVTRECTINLHKHTYKVGLKKKAPRYVPHRRVLAVALVFILSRDSSFHIWNAKRQIRVMQHSSSSGNQRHVISRNPTTDMLSHSGTPAWRSLFSQI